MNEETTESCHNREDNTQGRTNWLILLASLAALAATFINDNADLWQVLLPVIVVLLYSVLGSGFIWHPGRPLAATRGLSLGRTGSSSQRRHAPPAIRKAAVPPKEELRQDSKVPVRAPSFSSEDFSEQVSELLTQITPTAESERLAQQLAQAAKVAIQQVFPEVDVVGFASGDVARGTAFGVAVPELDIVASASPHVLVQHLQGRLSKGGLSMAKLDARKLQKSAIRVCTDHLVSDGGFKFRRSAFRGQEPKVTLMAPPCIGTANKRIPVDFSVNSMTPLYNAALLAECSRIDVRVRPLILLVRRWAKDRGICHAAKGHLAPYAWTLLVIYFLQVGTAGGPVLPPLQGFKLDTGLTVRRGGAKPDAGRGCSSEATALANVPVSDLFIGFLRFYAEEINWHKEAVSVRLGRRASANLHLMLHIIVHEDQSTEVGPSIEDPFEPARNLGMSATATGVARLREELARAHVLAAVRGASLSELLEPWAPAERARGSSDEGGDREEDFAVQDDATPEASETPPAKPQAIRGHRPGR